jgi:ATP-binding cassette subfamily C protein CydD
MSATDALAAPVRSTLAGAALLDIAAVAATIGQVATLAALLAPVLLDGADLRASVAPALMLLALTLLRAALLGAREIIGQRAAVQAKSLVRMAVFQRLVQLGPSTVHGERTGELVTLLGEGVERLDAYVSRYMPQTVLSVTGPLLIAAYVGWIDPLSACVLVLSAPLIPLLMVAVGSFTEEHIRGQWTALGRLSAYILDLLEGLPTLKLLGRADDQGRRLETLSAAFRDRTLHVLRFAFLSSLVLELLTTAAIAVVAVELGLRLLDGGIAFAATLQVLLLAPEFYRPLRELGAQRHAAMEARPPAERLQTLRALPAAPAVITASPARAVGPLAVELREVSYTYPEAPSAAVRSVSTVLRPGSRTALVGPSGAGKTTLASLILRFREPTSGALLADGLNITNMSVEQWRERIALVPQRPYLFDASALDNLRLARPSASLLEVERAADLAGAHEFLQQLPHGYHTRLGERGARLSGGQAQRLAIARAFLKAAPLLVLDEPTSALDAESEGHVRLALELLAPLCTVLLIAHRLDTIMAADRVLVLAGGEIVESGTHADLVASEGLYSRLVGAESRMVLA